MWLECVVLLTKQSTVKLILAACLLVPLASCADGSLGGGLQKALEADPKLRGTESSENSTTVTTASTPTPQTQVQLPEDFPGEIPRYPNGELREVVLPTREVASEAADAPTIANPPTSPVVTRWVSADRSDRVLTFYRNQLQTNNWQLLDKPSDDVKGTLTARQGTLTVTVTVRPSSSPPAEEAEPNTAPSTDTDGAATGTDFEISYLRNEASSGQGTSSPAATPTNSPSSGELAQVPAFSSTTTVGASGGSSNEAPPSQPVTGPIPFTDLDKTPKELRSYVEELSRLGVLTPSGTNTKAASPKSSDRFEPNKVITRREYARWLVSVNNRLFSDRSAQQIRLGLDSSQPAFRDVPRTDPDFAAIQGLAEAGLIPSSLTGDSTTVTFRPNDPLTRENLLLWKVPIDTRQSLPTATIEAIKQTWGFQDAARIESRALKAVLADFQNGDQANVRRAFGYTTLFQPKKSVTRAEAAATLWYFGYQGEGRSAQDALKGQ